MSKWSFAVDRGGTFTDVVGFSPDGRIVTTKLLSESPDYPNSSIEGVRRILERATLPLNESGSITGSLSKPLIERNLNSEEVAFLKLGSTVATNALLERKGADVCFITSKGFGDILAIGNQDRPHIFQLPVKKTEVLYKKVVEVEERLDFAGKVVQPICEEKVKSQLKEILNQGVQSLAIALMHSWINPLHEQKIALWAQELGFIHISCSSTLSPLVKLVPRGQTTVVDAYLTPVLKKYVQGVTKEAKGVSLKFMQSNGGLTSADFFSGSGAILSGPAGGVIAFSHIAQMLGFKKAIGFDMGGTSTDVSRFDGKHEKIYETKVNGIPLQTDMLHIVTVAAGGGSILGFDGEKMSVGPSSAGANPGPACYGKEGPLTLTDANLLLGKIRADFFPQVFGLEGNAPLDIEIVKEKFSRLREEIFSSTGQELSSTDLAEGFLEIANANMGGAIKEISVARGFDLSDYVLICFGGAGAQHACAIARSLKISKVLIHPLGSLLSAYGIALADVVKTAAQSILKEFSEEILLSLEEEFLRILKEPKEGVEKECGQAEIEVTRYLDIRPKGTQSSKTISWGSFSAMKKSFYEEYQSHYGISLREDRELEITNIRVEVRGKQKKPTEPEFALENKTWTIEEAKESSHYMYFQGELCLTPIYLFSKIQPGHKIIGPALVIEDHSTIVVEPQFQAEMNSRGHLVLSGLNQKRMAFSTEKDPIRLEIFHHLFQNIADQMGATLVNTAYSTNIKERLDFSCAIFDNKGHLVANAPHIPVHLGAMGESVRSVLEQHQKEMRPGDVYATNNPFAGGSHLPDITVVTPVFQECEGDLPKLIFIVASRGHHSDVGGITPGSMPPFSHSLAEEGVLLANLKIVSQGSFEESKVRLVFSEGAFPARNLEERLSDLDAQIAANYTGRKELLGAISLHGLDVVQAYMGHIQENAAMMTRLALGKLLEEKAVVTKEFIDYLDEGAQIQVKIVIEKGENSPHSHRAKIDFTGTSLQLPGNLNAPASITKAAVLYVFRTLIDSDIPLNYGCLDPLEIHIPEGCFLHPKFPAAVVGGNVETSQRVVDVLYGALNVMAASQGTMNNLTFGQEGNNSFGYYETICGGVGATPFAKGEDAVHSNMTNTRITDPEILEHRYPEVRLEEFSIRRGSGGKGYYCGGDGVIRRLRFLEERQVSILSERRLVPPYGLKGGEWGKNGRNTITDILGFEKVLPGKVSLLVQPGEMINIYTPGGGGFARLPE